MAWFNVKGLHEKIGVYLLYVKSELAYIGRSSNLRIRLNAHLNPNDLDYQEWKGQIDKIEYYICETAADSDIVETYLINTLHPTFNKDKVYLGGVTIELKLPEKHNLPNYEKDLSEELSSFSVKSLLQQYCDLVDNKEDLDIEYIQNKKTILEQAASQYHFSFDIKNIVETLGTKKINSCKYNLQALNDKMLLMSDETVSKVKKLLLQRLNITKHYLRPELKTLIQEVYDELGLKQTAKAVDIKYLLADSSIEPIFTNTKLNGKDDNTGKLGTTRIVKFS